LLPDNEARAAISAGRERIDKQIKSGIGEPFAGAQQAVLGAAFVAQQRHQRQTNLLRAIEALRMHAAEHGRFPDKLEDVTVVPVPRDPYTGKPFEYSGGGGVAKLSTPHDETWTPRAGAAAYELELRRPAEKSEGK